MNVDGLLLSGPRSAGQRGDALASLVAKFPPDDDTTVSSIVSALVLATPTEVEDGGTPPWRPDDEHAYQMLLGTY